LKGRPQHGEQRHVAFAAQGLQVDAMANTLAAGLVPLVQAIAALEAARR
jgi:hypothetical protein